MYCKCIVNQVRKKWRYNGLMQLAIVGMTGELKTDSDMVTWASMSQWSKHIFLYGREQEFFIHGEVDTAMLGLDKSPEQLSPS